MKNKLNVAVALIAGLAGGLITRYTAPPIAFAQDQSAIGKEIRAQNFVLVDASGAVVGTFTSAPQSGPDGSTGTLLQKGDIVLLDAGGKVIWRAGRVAASLASTTSK